MQVEGTSIRPSGSLKRDGSLKQGDSVRKRGSNLKRGGSIKLSFRKLRNRVTGNNDHHFSQLADTSTSVRSKSLPSKDSFNGSVKLEHDDFTKEKRRSNLKRGGSMKLSFRKLRNRVKGNNDHHFTKLEDTSTSVQSKLHDHHFTKLDDTLTSVQSRSLPSVEFIDGDAKLERDDFTKEKRRSNLYRSLSERWGRTFRRRRQYDVVSSDEMNVRGEHLLPLEQKQNKTRKVGIYIGDNHEVRKKIALASESSA